MKSKINFFAFPIALLISFFATKSFAACPSSFNLNFEKAGICGLAQFVVGPKADGENSMTLQFVDEHTLTPHELTSPLKVALFMPDMGHGSSPTLITKTSPGAFTISKMYFIMEGPWEVRISVGDEQQALPVNIQ